MIVQGSFLLGGEGCLKVLGLGLFKGFVRLYVQVHVHVGYSYAPINVMPYHPPPGIGGATLGI